MKTTGLTAKATSTNDPVVLFTAAEMAGNFGELIVINEGSVAGFFSDDGEVTWGRLPAGPSCVTVRISTQGRGCKFKREAGGSDVTGVFAIIH